MHVRIGILVRAHTGAEARKNAEVVLDRLVDNRSFDYWCITRANKYDSRASQNALQRLWKQQVRDFRDTLAAIRTALAAPDNVLMADSRFRYFCHFVGQYAGPAIRLYDGDGEGIRDMKHLTNAEQDWPGVRENPRTDIPLWLVEADVHY